jgi:hypothetical protein
MIVIRAEKAIHSWLARCTTHTIIYLGVLLRCVTQGEKTPQGIFWPIAESYRAPLNITTAKANLRDNNIGHKESV